MPPGQSHLAGNPDAEVGCTPAHMRRPGTRDQRLRRHAARVNAGSANELPLDQCDFHAAFGHDDAGDAEPAVEQVKRDGAAERVPDHDRRLGQCADKAIVVIDDLGDADLGESGVRGHP